MRRGYRGDIVRIDDRRGSWLAVVERARRRTATVRPCLQRDLDGSWYSFGRRRRVAWARLAWFGLCVAGAGRDGVADQLPGRPGVYPVE